MSRRSLNPRWCYDRRMPDTPLRSARVAVASLNPYYKNARHGDVNAIAESLKTLGQFKPVVVNTGTLTGRPEEILAGNHTHAAAKSLGWDEIDAVYVDVDDEKAAKIVLADNRTSDLSSYDNDALADLLGTLGDYSGTGFTEADYTRLLPKPAATEDEWAELKLPNFTVTYQLVFDGEEQQKHWNAYLRWLKANVPGESIGERIITHLSTQGIGAAE
ncbi:ParB-like nuclease domain protein [Arthrobacter phage Shrooms]|nr:ParB-like nuclease domain protein [Arthrobacter phage Shrooms]